jgi:phosphate starvation-inducible PhoH-like protein
MRGRTLNNAFVVLDEAQNTTPEQMKMFLTRLGFGTKMVVTGDVTQIDLPTGASGLQLVSRILEGMDDIHFTRLGSEDVVRHSLVGRIVDAYTKYDAERQARAFEGQVAREGANRAERRAGMGRPTQGRAPQDRKPRRDR